MNAMLEPRMVAARIQGPFVVAGCSHGRARIAASSQGGLAMVAIVHCLTEPVPKISQRDFAKWLRNRVAHLRGLSELSILATTEGIPGTMQATRPQPGRCQRGCRPVFRERPSRMETSVPRLTTSDDLSSLRSRW